MQTGGASSHVVRVLALTAVLLACMFLPFLPGEHDRLAATASMMSRACGVVGLVLVPIGVSWWIAGSRRPGGIVERPLAVAALCASSLVALCAVVVAWAGAGTALAVGAAAVLAYVLARVVRARKRLDGAVARTPDPAALYLVLIPIALVACRVLLLERAVGSSRNLAIRNSAELIRDIERYHTEHGRYPPSLAALCGDYKPGVIGVERYQYEPNGDAYNVYFEPFALPFGPREIVMFNRLDEHAAFSHTMDRFEHTREALRVGSGWYAAHDAPSVHWKYFWFD